MLTFTKAFPYAGITGYRAAVEIDGITWVQSVVWPTLEGCVELVRKVRARGAIGPVHWAKYTSDTM